MKDIHAISGKQDIITFTNTLWQTDMFRIFAGQKSSPLHGILEKFAELPRVFYRYTDPSIERFHNTPWFSALADLSDIKFKNPYVADMALLHEICHMAYAEYDINLSFEAWHQKMLKEEALARTISDVMVYFWMPDLRPLTFEQPIWADRFLNEDNYALFAEDPKALKDYIMRARLECMKETHKNSADPEVRRIAQYGFSNYEWSSIWQESYREVEFKMYLLIYGSMRNRESALSDHISWLKSKMLHGIPFRAQAEAYAAHLDEVYGD
ncbi:MAG: hypothetical protein VX730_01170 [Pseudomonadota bacterium]|nr:hypothetical protein [Pseudomonadota bacterium]